MQKHASHTEDGKDPEEGTLGGWQWYGVTTLQETHGGAVGEAATGNPGARVVAEPMEKPSSYGREARDRTFFGAPWCRSWEDSRGKVEEAASGLDIEKFSD